MRILALFIAAASLLLAETPVNKRVFIEPQDGFESYVSAAIIKKQVPVTITMNREEADYVIASKVTELPESTGGKIARCMFAYCAGIGGSQTATVTLVDAKNGAVAWAYNVRKGGSHNYQSSAEAIAKHLKEWVRKQGKR